MPLPASFIASSDRIGVDSARLISRCWPYLAIYPIFAAVKTSTGKSYFGRLFRIIDSLMSFASSMLLYRSGAAMAATPSGPRFVTNEVGTVAPFSNVMGAYALIAVTPGRVR